MQIIIHFIFSKSFNRFEDDFEMDLLPGSDPNDLVTDATVVRHFCLSDPMQFLIPPCSARCPFRYVRAKGGCLLWFFCPSFQLYLNQVRS